jgi:hypothetical protein
MTSPNLVGDIRFVGVIGDQGSGKTNYICDQLYRAHMLGKPIVANFTLEFPFELLPFKELATLPEALQNAVIGMDELGRGADSYEFFEGQPKALGRLVTQLRKRNCIAYYTVQRLGLVAKRLRQQTGIFILMHDLDANIPHGDPSQDESKTNYHCQGLFHIEFFTPDLILLQSGTFDGRPTRHLYNTTEIIWN